MSSRNAPFVFLIDRATATTTVPQNLQVFDGPKDIALTFTSEGTTTGGTLKIEESDLSSYTGTWSQIGSTINANDFNGVKQVYHIRMGAGMWVRVRIATTITGGGTVSVTATGM